MFVEFPYVFQSQVPSANLSDINKELAAANLTTFQPTMVGVAPGDMSLRKGVYSRTGGVAHLGLNITWNNTDGGTAGDAVQVDLPWQAADYSGFDGPSSSQSNDTSGSVWPTIATDRRLVAVVNHLGGFATMTISRISTTNSSPGQVLNDTGVATQIFAQISYWTSGVKLV